MKGDGLFGRRFLKGMKGDAMNAILCGVGHNLRKILARPRVLLSLLSGKARAELQALILQTELLSLPQPAPIPA